VPVDEAVGVAVATRLDLQTAKERLQDAERRVPIAKNSLLPQVDATASAGFASNSTNGFVLPDPKFNNWSAGLNVDLGLDRKSQRNDFRRTLIQVEQTRRQFSLAVDNENSAKSSFFRFVFAAMKAR
jgi:outer membrane protein TolC